MGEWRGLSSGSREKNSSFLALRAAGIADPLAEDVPIAVLRLVGDPYFKFEDAINAAFEDVIRLLGPTTTPEELIANLDGKIIEANVKVTIKVEKQDLAVSP